MKLNSKWSYLMSGANLMMALVGALISSLPLLIMGCVFGFWNWIVAEHNRSLEDESIRESVTTEKEDNK